VLRDVYGTEREQVNGDPLPHQIFHCSNEGDKMARLFVVIMGAKGNASLVFIGGGDLRKETT
jgi:hypothetical protein